MSAATISLSEQVIPLLREASEWRLLSLLLECPREDWRERTAQLGAESQDAHLREAAQYAVDQASEGLYHSIFGPGGPAPPREVSYRETMQPGYMIAELEAYYEAFGFHPQLDEAPDHVAVMAGFMGYLRLKQAFALSAGDSEAEAVSRDAAAGFIDDHLATIGERIANLLENSGIPYLQLAGQALVKRTGPAKKNLFPIQQDSEDADNIYGCGESGSGDVGEA